MGELVILTESGILLFGVPGADPGFLRGGAKNIEPRPFLCACANRKKSSALQKCSE